MKKQFLILSFLCFLFVINVYAQKEPKLKKISEHVYAYVGITQASPAENSFGANCGVIIGSDSVLVIDTLVSAKQAQRLIKEIKQITDKPIKYAVNTHYHFDHSWGNSEFAKLGAIIIGQKNMPLTKEQADEIISHPEAYGVTSEDLAGTSSRFPDVLVENDYQIDLGIVNVSLHYPGPSHTKDSMTIFVNEDNVLFVGDIIFNKYHPFLGEGDITSWINILSGLEESTAKVIVPGHGPVVVKSDIQEMAEYLRVFDKQAQILSENKTQADAPIIAEKMLILLPDQKRTELPHLIEMNLRMKYLPQIEPEK